MHVKTIQLCCGSRNCPTLSIDLVTKQISIVESNNIIEMPFEMAKLLRNVLGDLITEAEQNFPNQ